MMTQSMLTQKMTMATSSMQLELTLVEEDVAEAVDVAKEEAEAAGVPAEAEAGVSAQNSNPSNMPDLKRVSVSCVVRTTIGLMSALISIVDRKTPRAR